MKDPIYKPSGKAAEYAHHALNLYTGCDNGCTYCLDGKTLVMLSNSKAVAIRNLKVGDELLGVSANQSGNNRRKYIKSTVEAIWTTKKQVYEIELENGMKAKCSGDHRWLTERGWKFTTGEMGGPNQRPYLTTNNVIRTVSAPNTTPLITDDYRLGYLSGMIRGDGNIGHYGPKRKTITRKDRPGIYVRKISLHTFSLRLTDIEPLIRVKEYLAYFGLCLKPIFDVDEKTKGIRTHSKRDVEKIEVLIKWKKTREYLRGFVAGIYDAEGSYSTVIRISNSDKKMLRTTENSLRQGRFEFIRDVPHKAVNVTVHSIRLLGGRKEQIRFWQWCDPAILRKRTIAGYAVSGYSKVKSITRLGRISELYDIQTSSGNFIANGMVSHNCYSPAVLHVTREAFTYCQPRPGIIEAIEHQVARWNFNSVGDAYRDQRVLLCFTCDPYPSIDEYEHLTSKTLHILNHFEIPFQVLTKSGSRALGDMPIYGPNDAFASTLTFTSAQDSQKWEPNAALPADRMLTLKKFHEAGIHTWVSLEPVIDPEQTLELIKLTHSFVDLYKVGKLNYVQSNVNWLLFGVRAIRLLETLGKKYYIKADLANHLDGITFKNTDNRSI